MANSMEAKIVVLGSQGVGKTSLVHRYVKNAFTPPTTTSTIGASFLTKKVVDIDTSTTVRLQIWDTAGQERFRSISKLYYRGANAAVLCYDITDPHSFDEMGRWLHEIKQNLGNDIIFHVVGTKSDIVAEDPSRRKVPFERCIAYIAENLFPVQAGQGQNGQASTGTGWGSTPAVQSGGMASPQSNRSSGFWGQEIGWDCCHEISAKDGEGVDEVFRVITRKLVEQQQRKFEDELATAGITPGMNGNGDAGDYFDYRGNANGSFRVGVGDKRRSWLGFPTSGFPPTPGAGPERNDWEEDVNRLRKAKGGKCC
ncbi:P-loop containing nucleoside triphosphate hydrolase protein [Amniculicola lignicola CBS 123094]|uniref:P-loop containing nucleoside triphosphate hydrolase protein n=1 Tax=Amniculicola lignicola CBS 123094 TaxID=1392246 RepID=A0A6A5WGC7_9PLEO|nr:P-loop containing nucleoside triphosphate hydrolase protein [Amniculicola lignicola CBS 123094]